MSITVIYNPKSGTSGNLDQIKNAFTHHDIQPTYLPITSRQLTRHIKSSAGNSRNIIVAAGGDGTVNFVANLLHNAKAKMGVIPSGTLNHFAKDLGLPLDVKKAVRVIVTGNTKHIDAAMVNKKLFINNSSIGLYPRSLRARDEYDDHIGKWPAAVIGAIKVLARPRRYRVTITFEGKQITRRTPFVFIGNNDYHIDTMPISRRKEMDAGILSIYIIKADNPFAVMRMFVQALFTKKPRTAELEQYNVAACKIATKRHRKLHVAFDGEVATLKTPLEYTSLPGSLRVIVP